jgi:hypothetical protein
MTNDWRLQGQEDYLAGSLDNPVAAAPQQRAACNRHDVKDDNHGPSQEPKPPGHVRADVCVNEQCDRDERYHRHTPGKKRGHRGDAETKREVGDQQPRQDGPRDDDVAHPTERNVRDHQGADTEADKARDSPPPVHRGKHRTDVPVVSPVMPLGIGTHPERLEDHEVWGERVKFKLDVVGVSQRYQRAAVLLLDS